MNVAVFSKPDCPYCDKVKKIFKLTNINCAVYNLDEHFNRDAFVSEFGEGSTFPQVIVDGKKIGGCIDTVKYLKEKNIV